MVIEIGDLVTLRTECVYPSEHPPLYWLGLVTKIEDADPVKNDRTERLIYVLWCGDPVEFTSAKFLTSDFESNLIVYRKAKRRAKCE